MNKRIIAYVLLGCLILLTLLYGVFLSPYNADKPLILGTVLPFELIDSNGQSFSDKDLIGKVWVADFIFTSCAGVCPLMTLKMQNLYRSYEREENVRFVSISVDPDVDSPQKLSEYAKKYSAQTHIWHFLTGTYEKIHDIAVKSFKVGKVDEPIFHSDRFILVDKNLNIRGYYAFDDKKDMKRLFHEIALVLNE